jgi:hypothetical protein
MKLKVFLGLLASVTALGSAQAQQEANLGFPESVSQCRDAYFQKVVDVRIGAESVARGITHRQKLRNQRNSAGAKVGIPSSAAGGAVVAAFVARSVPVWAAAGAVVGASQYGYEWVRSNRIANQERAQLSASSNEAYYENSDIERLIADSRVVKFRSNRILPETLANRSWRIQNTIFFPNTPDESAMKIELTKAIADIVVNWDQSGYMCQNRPADKPLMSLAEVRKEILDLLARANRLP